VFERLESLVRDHLSTEVLATIAVVSLLAFLLGLIGVPWFLVRLPADHFVRPESRAAVPTTPWKWLLFLARNAAGALLVVLGLMLLVLPGQGILTILAGAMLLDLPGKRRLIRRLLARGRVLAAINALRKRAGRPPLEMPSSD